MVIGSVAPCWLIPRCRARQCLFLQFQACVEVHLSRLRGLVPEPERDDRAVDAMLEEVHRCAVAEDVRRHPLTGERWARLACGGDVLGQDVSDAIAAERATSRAGKQGFGGSRAALTQPTAQNIRGVPAKRGAALLTTLAPAEGEDIRIIPSDQAAIGRHSRAFRHALGIIRNSA